MDKRAPYGVTKKDFLLFQKEVRKWVDFFGLKQWELHFLHEEIGDRAQVWFSDISGIATFKLCKFSEDLMPPNMIRRTAFHEVCELLMVPLTSLTLKWYSQDVMQARVHDIIRRLENTVFEESI